MQLTRFDRWLLTEFVHETHVYTMSPPPSIPPGVREEPLPEAPGRRFKHHYIASKEKQGEALIAALRQSGQIFSTQVHDRKAWYVPFIAAPGVSVTWRLFWIVIGTTSTFAFTSYIYGILQDPKIRQTISEAIKVFQG